jgi:hypothetical protein
VLVDGGKAPTCSLLPLGARKPTVCSLEGVAPTLASTVRRVLDAVAWGTESVVSRVVVGVLALGLGLILALHPHVPLGPLVVLMGCGMFVNAIAPVDPVRPALNRALTWIARTAWAIGGILVLAVPVTTIAGLVS